MKEQACADLNKQLIDSVLKANVAKFDQLLQEYHPWSFKINEIVQGDDIVVYTASVINLQFYL